MTSRRLPPPLRLVLSKSLDVLAVDERRARAASARAKIRAAAVSLDQARGQRAARVLARPREALEEYTAGRGASEVSRILAAAGTLRELVDRVVIVGSAATLSATRALAQACTHPFHNELSRGARGTRPRYYFVCDDIDNDALHGLLELLEHDGPTQGPEARWGLIAVDSGDSRATHEIFRLLSSRMVALPGDAKSSGDRSLVAACEGSAFADLAGVHCPSFAIEKQLAGPWSLFTAATLLPAAVLGIDIVRLLVGGAAVSIRFGEEARDVALELAACRQVLGDRGALRRTLTARPRALQGFCDWHNEWLAQASPAAVQKLEVTSLRNRCDVIRLEALSASQSDADEPSLTLELPALDEASLGQLVQTLMLATVVEADLNGFNAGR